MRHRVIAGTTMIVAASLIGVTQARLPRPVRDYRDRVSVEMSEFAILDSMAGWPGAWHGAPTGRHWRLRS